MCEGCGCEQPPSLYTPGVCVIANREKQGMAWVIELAYSSDAAKPFPHDAPADETGNQKVLLSVPGIGEECFLTQSPKSNTLRVSVAQRSALSRAIVSLPIGSGIGIRGPFGANDSLQTVFGNNYSAINPRSKAFYSRNNIVHTEKKPTIALCMLNECDGCLKKLSEIKDAIGVLAGTMDVFDAVSYANSPVGRYSIAILIGRVLYPSQEDFVKELRSNSRIVVAADSCTDDTTSLRRFIRVDHSVYGCPVFTHELSKIVKAVIVGADPFVPGYPVCSECKMQAVECMFDKGYACLGPVTRAGCNAVCPQNDISCTGCRGLSEGADADRLSTIISQKGLQLHNAEKRTDAIDA